MAAKLVFENQFGEETIGTVMPGNTFPQGSPALVTGCVLTGLAVGTNVAIAAGDTILVALAKLQAQIDAL